MKVKLIYKIKYFIASVLPDKIHISIMYFIKMKKKLNLNNPKTFGEKMQYIKLYGNLELNSNFVDKYEVREYIKNAIGEQYLNELLGVYESVEQINFNSLPEKFVLKVTHGSGYNIICNDKKNFDIDEAKNKINEWMKESYYIKGKEPQYKNIKPRIICEKYLQDESGELRDYKFFCFSGKPRFIQVDSNRFSCHTRDFYDSYWNKLNLTFKYENSDNKIEKPDKLDEMLQLCEILSREFPFIRVDFYFVNNNIYFGELTFNPENGYGQFNPLSEDLKIAELIDLEKYSI